MDVVNHTLDRSIVPQVLVEAAARLPEPERRSATLLDCQTRQPVGRARLDQMFLSATGTLV